MPKIIDKIKKKISDIRGRAKSRVRSIRGQLGIGGGEGKGTIMERAKSRVQELRSKVKKRKGKVLGGSSTSESTSSTETRKQRGL